jgi:hypothetical protein
MLPSYREGGTGIGYAMLDDAFSTSPTSVDAVPRAHYDVLVASRGLVTLKPDLTAADAPHPEPRAEFDASTVDAARLARRYVELKEIVAKRHDAIADLQAAISSLQGTVDPMLTHETVARTIAAIKAKLVSVTSATSDVVDDASLVAMEDLATRYAQLRCRAFTALFCATDERIAVMTTELANQTEELAVLAAILAIARQSVIPIGVQTDSGKACPICFDKDVDTCNVPCGHTLCATCSERTSGRCWTCRMTVRETVKLFFSA